VGKKLLEWLGRYLPCEIAGTVGELGGAVVAYLLTGSTAAAAVTATVGASVGYYAAAYLNAMRWAYREQCHHSRTVRVLVANLIALRSVAIEFGPAELIDSVLVRPAAYYIGPQIFDNVAAGWIFGKLVSDVAFYIFAIFSYERFKGLLVRRPQAEEVDGEPVTTVTPA
jgi:hypothetical protein